MVYAVGVSYDEALAIAVNIPSLFMHAPRT